MGFLAASLTQCSFSASQFEELSKLVRNRIQSVSSPDLIIIFGSYARGKITGTSDLDIAILFNDRDTLRIQKKIILNSKLFLDYSSDILFYTCDDFEKKASLGGVCAIIKNEGIIIYDKRAKI